MPVAGDPDHIEQETCRELARPGLSEQPLPSNIGAGPVAVACVHGQAWPFRGDLNFAKLGNLRRFVGNVADAVLAAQIFFNLSENLVDSQLFPRHFKIAAAGSIV